MEFEIAFCIKVVRIACTVLVFLLVFLMLAKGNGESKALEAYRELEGFLKKNPKGKSWYLRVMNRLTRYGASFHYGKNIRPIPYFLLRMLLFLLGVLVVGRVDWALGVFCGLAFYFLPDFLLWYLNKKDNEAMLPEIKLIYHTMEIQIKAGVYVMDALVECYGGVTHKRLKTALLDLAGDIAIRADVYDALGSFQAKFENSHINALCVTICQALESGQAVELLRDLGEQVKDMEQLVLVSKKASLDRSLTFYQLGILTVVLGLTLYVCIVQMLDVEVGL